MGLGAPSLFPALLKTIASTPSTKSLRASAPNDGVGVPAQRAKRARTTRRATRGLSGREARPGRSPRPTPTADEIAAPIRRRTERLDVGPFGPREHAQLRTTEATSLAPASARWRQQRKARHRSAAIADAPQARCRPSVWDATGRACSRLAGGRRLRGRQPRTDVRAGPEGVSSCAAFRHPTFAADQVAGTDRVAVLPLVPGSSRSANRRKVVAADRRHDRVGVGCALRDGSVTLVDCWRILSRAVAAP